VTINGPFDKTGAPVEPPNRRKVFVCHPPDNKDAKDEIACASRILAGLARQAFRRPVTDADLSPLMHFFAEGRAAGSFEHGIEFALTAMLSSAKFLYRTEPPPANASLDDLQAERHRAGVAAVVLPLVEHPRRGTADAGRAAQAERAEDVRGAGAPHARGSALEDADDEFRV